MSLLHGLNDDVGLNKLCHTIHSVFITSNLVVTSLYNDIGSNYLQWY